MEESVFWTKGGKGGGSGDARTPDEAEGGGASGLAAWGGRRPKRPLAGIHPLSSSGQSDTYLMILDEGQVKHAEEGHHRTVGEETAATSPAEVQESAREHHGPRAPGSDASSRSKG